MLKRNFVLLMAAFLFIFSGSASLWADAKTDKQFALAKQQFDAGDLDNARDNFIDVMMNGTPDQMQEANQYMNKIHNKMGNITEPVFVPSDGTAVSSGTAAASSYDGGPSYQGHILGGSDNAVSSTDVGGGVSGGDSGTMTDAQKEAAAAFVVTSLRQSAIDALKGTKGVKIYFRNNDVDAIDIDPSVLFTAPSKFSANGRQILENIYTLMVLSPQPTFVILPPGSYTDNVKLDGVKNAVSMAAYLIYRGVSPAKLSYNMGLYNEAPPAKFSNLDGLSVVFDYDTPPLLNMPNSGEKLPLMSLAIAPTSQAMYADSEGGMLLDYSVIQTASPISDWTLQIIQQGADKKYYVIRQIEGSGPIYNQTFWNGRKNFYGDKLPAGVYTALLTATDTSGRTKSLRRKMTIVSKTPVKTASAGTSAASYKSGYLWTRPGRKNLSPDMQPADNSNSGYQPYQPTAAAAPVTPGADYSSGYTAEDFAIANNKGTTTTTTTTTATGGTATGYQPYQPPAAGGTVAAAGSTGVTAPAGGTSLPASATGGSAGTAGYQNDNSGAGANNDYYEYNYNNQ
ncbi:MAG: hypothetical protein FWF35_02160 [Elusimicrobia bacterium]|nr:hypothetical protein [Elusimicrobiota bacterium]